MCQLLQNVHCVHRIRSPSIISSRYWLAHLFIVHKKKPPEKLPHWSQILLLCYIPPYSLNNSPRDPLYSVMSRPYLCSDPNLNDHSSSEGGFVSIFGFAVSASVYLLSHGCGRCEEALICRCTNSYRLSRPSKNVRPGREQDKQESNGYLIASSSRYLWSFRHRRHAHSPP